MSDSVSARFIVRRFPLQTVDAARVAHQRVYGLTRHDAGTINAAIIAVNAALGSYYDAAEHAQALIAPHRDGWWVPDEYRALDELSNGSLLPSLDRGDVKGGHDAYPVSRWERETAEIRALSRRLVKALAQQGGKEWW